MIFSAGLVFLQCAITTFTLQYLHIDWINSVDDCKAHLCCYQYKVKCDRTYGSNLNLLPACSMSLGHRSLWHQLSTLTYVLENFSYKTLHTVDLWNDLASVVLFIRLLLCVWTLCRITNGSAMPSYWWLLFHPQSVQGCLTSQEKQNGMDGRGRKVRLYSN